MKSICVRYLGGLSPEYSELRISKMISAEQWWSIIEAYGAEIWPAQIIFYIIAALLVGSDVNNVHQTFHAATSSL